MADLFNLGNMSPGEINEQDGTNNLKTGDLRRKYNFGDQVSELAIAQDPFFRFLSMAAKRPTNDPSFKFTERRPSWHKRYAYVTGASAWSSGSATGLTYNATFAPPTDTADGTYAVKMGTDYKSAGNLQNIFGQSSATRKITIGDSGTAPQFFLVDQLVKIPVHGVITADGTIEANSNGWQVCKIVQVEVSGNYAYLGIKVVKTHGITLTGTGLVAFKSLDWLTDSPTYGVIGDTEGTAGETHGLNIAERLEPARSYVVGNAHAEGSGYPETWKDQPFSFSHGQTQIWKTSMAMTNTARATELKYERNEWARIWREKLIEHKWDIEQDLLFGTQYTDADGVQYTQGAVDYCLNNGNIFSLDYDTKTSDDFLEDMASYFDPRYNGSGSTVFFCDTATFNWLNKVSGYFSNNAGNINPGTAYDSRVPHANSLGRADFSMSGSGKKFGVSINQISTPYGTMNVARNIHLDGSHVKIMGMNMKYCAYRPLAGNGLNRDTSVYVGVQTIENSGVDRRVDLIQTEAGMEWQMPECHAVWK